VGKWNALEASTSDPFDSSDNNDVVPTPLLVVIFNLSCNISTIFFNSSFSLSKL
jgi:hypothetical protein